MLLRLLEFARAAVELTEAEVAVGDEGAHVEFVGECHRLAVVAFAVLDVRRFAMRRDLALQSKSQRFDAALFILASERKCMCGKLRRVGRAIFAQTDLTQIRYEKRSPPGRPDLLDGFFDKGCRLWDAPDQRIRGTKLSGRSRTVAAHAGILGQLDKPFQRGNRSVEVSFSEVGDTEAGMRMDHGPGAVDRFGDAERFFAARDRFGETAELRQ